jgi:hypothetical protein
LVETVGTEQSDEIAAVAALTVEQSIKMAEATTRLARSAGRLISRLCIGLCIGLRRMRLSIKAPSVALHQALHQQALRPHRSASGCAFGRALVALHCIVCVCVCVRVCVRGSKTSTGDASDDLLTVY